MSNQIDKNKLAGILMKIGGCIVVAALIWFFWYTYQLLGDFKYFKFGMLACLFTSSGECGFAFMLSKYAYSPFVMWLGLLMVAGGVLLRKIIN